MDNKQFEVSYKKHTLEFKFDAGTSRGILKTRDVYYIIIKERKGGRIYGLGEAAPLKGLSIDDRPDFELAVKTHCQKATEALAAGKPITDIPGSIVKELPALRFGFEMALRDLENGGKRIYYGGDFTSGKQAIPINGLIWMNSKEHMLGQVKEKIAAGFRCIKMKIGAIHFEEECAILSHIRNQYDPGEMMLRVDANGAFDPANALEKLKKLAGYQLHSIEQPILVGNIVGMAQLCAQSPLSIALDEELIGVFGLKNKKTLLEKTKPRYIILKPTLLGGFQETDEWIQLAENMQIGWWLTSALESNIGLNAIAQYTAQLPYDSYQGLGTGSLYHNNIASPLRIAKGQLYYDRNISWDLTLFQQ